MDGNSGPPEGGRYGRLLESNGMLAVQLFTFDGHSDISGI